MANKARFGVAIISVGLVMMALVSAFSIGTAHGSTTTITAYQSKYVVNVKGPYQASQWSDTPTITERISGMTFAVKQNGTGWLFLMIWKQSTDYCYDAGCFGGIELGHVNNTQAMGSPTTPTIMILTSTSFTGNVDEFISTGEQTPTPVESDGYTTQSVCGLTVANSQYTVQCYRPFKLTNASPFDFPTLGVGSTIEIGFAIGEFTNPGDHTATDMSTYTLTFSSNTYATSSTSSTSSSSTSSTSSSSSTSTSTSRSTSTTQTTSTKSTTSSTSTSSTSPTTTSATSTTTRTTTPTTSTCSTMTSSGPLYAITVATNAQNYSATEALIITGCVSPAPGAGAIVAIQVTSPEYTTVVYNDSVPVAPSGAYGYIVNIVANSTGWVYGTYTLTVTAEEPAPMSVTSQFFYTQYAVTITSSTSTVVSTTTILTSFEILSTSTTTQTLTTTTTSTITGPPITVTGTVTTTATTTAPPYTVTNTQTTTLTTASTATQNVPGLPGWGYAVIALLLFGCLAIGYVFKTLLDSRKWSSPTSAAK